MKHQQRVYALTWFRRGWVERWARKLQRWSGLALVAFAGWHIWVLFLASANPEILSAHLSTLYNLWFMAVVFFAAFLHTAIGVRSLIVELLLLRKFGDIQFRRWLSIFEQFYFLLIISLGILLVSAIILRRI